MTRLNTLFVCSRNQWRSPTAEQVFRDDPRLAVRSGGLSSKSRRTVNATDLQWADAVFVMEPKHAARIRSQFRDSLGRTPLYVLEIPDDYRFMDPDLIDLIRDRVESQLEELLDKSE